MSEQVKFEGWRAMNGDSVKGNFSWGEYEPKPFDEDDIDIKIHYCGLCGSDIHTASAGWGEQNWPQVVGHEIVGEVVKAGPKAIHKVGDIVGVGAQNDSCLECEQCKNHREPYCDKGQVGTYSGVYGRHASSKGAKSYGGYANYHRCPSHFAVKIPDGLDPAIAAPMCCGGVTVYSPLKQYGCGTTAKKVGIVGIGGLGHFGLLFAKALGAEKVVAISHSSRKKEDAMKMGATDFWEVHDDKDAKDHKKQLDLIICTSNSDKIPLLGYLQMLRPSGHFVMVGAPESPLPQIPAFPLILANVHISGSAIGSPSVIKEMLELAAKQNIKSWIQKVPLSSVNETVPKFCKEGASYRYVFVNQNNGGKL